MMLRAPASTANLGPGFDVFSIALREPYDLVKVEVREGHGVYVNVSGPHGGLVPTNPARNSAGLVALRALELAGVRARVEIEIDKRIPVASGLGSSAAPASAVAYAMNKLLGLGLDDESLVRLAGYGERASAGVEHYDNVAASLLGWFNIVRADGGRLDLVNLKPPDPGQMVLVIVTPRAPGPVDRKTGVARSVLPKEVQLSKVVWNVASASMIVAGVLTGDVRLVGRGMSDLIVEPAREALVPYYRDLKKAAMDNGALGFAISGAGPSVLALTNSNKVAGRVARAMETVLSEGGLGASSITTNPGEGVREL